ncbi:putative receptor protein kinase ZmPK1 [Rutidosis leptorrhynchoides]|uniref:putative receptor protein kinase ZmPK1 n=1 Tax=Rutidosis leptorrhynchoides TaxID=125765 RepID=UPI003A9919CB
MTMSSLFCLLHLLIILTTTPFTCSSFHLLSKGSSISVDHKDDHIVSPNRLFTAGFYKVGINAYSFSIWFTENIQTVVWTANRDVPVNGIRSKLSLYKNGNLVLEDADKTIVWSTETKATNGSLVLKLENNGNLVLYQINGHPYILWQSFDYPTDTLLPNQPFTRNSQLVSSRSRTNFSSGFFKLYFENNNVLSLLYDGPEITSVYWPEPYLKTWDAGRSTYNNSRIAKLDSRGEFNSSDEFGFFVSDFGAKVQRIMKVDFDGNIRVYSLVKGQKWEVQWQAFSRSCKIHGVCGPNSLCTYSSKTGRKCNCVHGYKKKDPNDWSYGCEPEFKPCQKEVKEDFVELHFVEFYGYDLNFLHNSTLEACKQSCLNDCNCKGFQYKFDTGVYNCFLKNLLYNGYQSGFENSVYIKLPKSLVSSYQERFNENSRYVCPSNLTMSVTRSYYKKHEIGTVKALLWFGGGIGVLEILLILIFLYITSRDSSITAQSYYPIGSAFKRFTYTELKKATDNFSKEIGRGGAGVVYKGELSDDRIAAIKMLKEVSDHQGEAEFQAEISTIGRLNHMNLIETWGYCVEGKHRLVVYEFMENGSLAKMLESNKLDWEKKLEIAIGTAKGLAYLHEECLEWVLHCDVKPHNILLDSSYSPKVADFGLSKLFDRSAGEDSDFSRIRGTRGYMAPEWVFNLPITSKVDVYSYGVVILEMITGRSPLQMQQSSGGNSGRDQTLVEWVRDKINDDCVEEIVDVETCGEYDTRSLKNVLNIALQCAEEDRDARPSMSQVVHMLLHPELDD